MSKNICITCYLHTGFQHKLEWWNVHTHTNNGLVFKYSLDFRVQHDLDNREEHYLGVSPYIPIKEML